MIVQALTPFLKRYLTLAKIFSLYFEWDETKGKIILRDEKHHLKVKGWMVLEAIYVIVQALLIRSRGFDLVEKFSAALILILYLARLILRFERRVDLVPMLVNNWSLSEAYKKFGRGADITIYFILITYSACV